MDRYIRAFRPWYRPQMVTSLTEIPAPDEPEHRIELAPNCALTPHGAAVFVGSTGLLVFAVAIFFASRGFWPVLPFAGLEVGLLAWAGAGQHALRRQPRGHRGVRCHGRGRASQRGRFEASGVPSSLGEG